MRAGTCWRTARVRSRDGPAACEEPHASTQGAGQQLPFVQAPRSVGCSQAPCLAGPSPPTAPPRRRRARNRGAERGPGRKGVCAWRRPSRAAMAPRAQSQSVSVHARLDETRTFRIAGMHPRLASSDARRWRALTARIALAPCPAAGAMRGPQLQDARARAPSSARARLTSHHRRRPATPTRSEHHRGTHNLRIVCCRLGWLRGQMRGR